MKVQIAGDDVLGEQSLLGNRLSGTPSRPSSVTGWRELFLDRLRRLLVQPTNPSDDRAIQRANCSAYLDRSELGTGLKVRSLLARLLDRPTPRSTLPVVLVRSNARVVRGAHDPARVSRRIQ